MAEPGELRQEAVVRFLRERGGRARNAELLEHFGGWLNPAEPGQRAAARQRFKELVNAVATVRPEPGTGAKYVHLRRRFCEPPSPRAPPPPPPPAPPPPAAPPAARRDEEEEEEAAGGSPGGRRSLRGGSPQLKRGAGRGRDSDSGSVASSSAEEEGSAAGSVALDPLEHAWMLSASDGRWESLEGLLSCEPALCCKRDFITGFTALHWAAKHGRQELLATLVNFAQRHRLPVDINARTSGGHTALHIAAMHGHTEVVKLLVGAYDADVDIRDYSGRKAAQYLQQGTSGDMRSLVGALDEEEEEEEEGAAGNGSGRWRLSKVLPSNLMSYRLSHHHHHHHHHSAGEEAEGTDGAAVPGKGKEMTRKASGSGRMKPRLNKIRFRTQIIHNTPSFRGDTEEEEQEEKSLKASFKLRPKSNVFG
ncbi:ankyrin repeat domain-containing protein SOWAHC [Anas platyrhynchos]|uniref:ankyrin repeat domain-containing protein SOWAHC n=1 Tax=Anas platyrhynchos TaxID=8839 RepID=UPI000F7C6197|nr:LOW QUALITY PROTEIN: ankyrin repeat domain-containing protein SOWAHC [Anas platyrhynchos]|eukprot:XP_027300733.1 ankyrin repeat domain-containing protein SOWAHC [Anas platyrhynchos]